MPKDNMKMGELFLKDMETGEVFKFNGLKSVDLGTEILEPVAELEESPIDGISILVSGSHLDKMERVCISIDMKEGD